MNSFNAKFILDLQAYLKMKMPEIKFVDQNLGQWGESNFGVSTGFPGLLVDFPDTDYSQLQGDDDLALGNIKISLFFSVQSQSYNLAPLPVRMKALDYYEIEHKLVARLKKWETDYFTRLARTKAVSRNQNELNLRIRELNFTTEYEESFDVDQEREIQLVFNGQIPQITPTD